jgi:hypothetical protein
MSTTSEPKSNSISDFSSQDAVTLVVGAEQKELLVHATYLTRDSAFFRVAFKKIWTEGQTRRIMLPEESLKTVSHYLTYVYHEKLPPSDVTLAERKSLGDSYVLLAELYICGERFLNRAFQHEMVVEILRLTRLRDTNGETWYPTGPIVNQIYRGTPEGSPMRRLLVDLHVVRGTKKWLAMGMDPQFFLDLANAIYEKIQAQKAVGEFRNTLLKAETCR